MPHKVFIVILSHAGIIDDNPLVTMDEGIALEKVKELCLKHFPDDFTEDSLKSLELHEIMTELREAQEGSDFEIIHLESELEIKKEPTAFGFSVEDIMQQAEEDEVEITEEDAIGVIELLLSKGDAETGVNWSTISYFIDVYIKSKTPFALGFAKFTPDTFDSVHELFKPIIDDAVSEINDTVNIEEILICTNTKQWIAKMKDGDYFTIAGRDSENGSYDDCVKLIRDNY